MVDPIFLVEAAINGILLGGVLALLALGLNLIFGVLDIVWIAYVELVMLCMYLVYFLVMVHGWPVWLAGLAAVALGAVLGVLLHLLIISPIITSAPVNQLLATGGLLFFLQSFATFLWTTDHRSVYWHMNFHIEHHMYAAVPCYNLGKLHRAIQADLPPCHGLVAASKEIVWILRKQKEDPTYQFIAELPTQASD